MPQGILNYQKFGWKRIRTVEGVPVGQRGNLSFLKKTRGVGSKAQNFARCSLGLT